MAKRDYYEVLGVDKNADDQSIKKSFKRLAMKYHPDRNKEPGADEKFKEINEAYAVLSDPQKRQAYDQFGFDAVDGQGANGFGGFGGGGFGGGGFEDIFSSVFGDVFNGGRGQGRTRQQRGEDLEQVVTITLEEAVKGCKKQIKINRATTCEKCHGTGCKDGSQPSTCSKCNGSGFVQIRQGFFAVQQTCPVCHGSGKEIHNPCDACRGQGRTPKNVTVDVTIPAGVDTGIRLHLAGQGCAGLNGASAGDLYVLIQVKKHAIFERDGLDLFVTVPISFAVATLGGKVEVPTLGGKISLTIKEGTQSGTQLRVAGKVIPSLNGGRIGSLYCTIVIETPVNLNDEQKELLRKFDTSINGDADAKKHKPQATTFFDKVKKFFDDFKGN